MYLRVTIIDGEKIGHRRVLIYSTDVLNGKRPIRVTRVCSCGTHLQISHSRRVAHVVAQHSQVSRVSELAQAASLSIKGSTCTYFIR